MKRKYIYFLDLCHCGCNEITYGNKKYIRGYTIIVMNRINNPMKRPDVVAKITGKNHPSCRIPRSEATKQKQSKSMKGKPSPMKGRHQSQNVLMKQRYV